MSALRQIRRRKSSRRKNDDKSVRLHERVGFGKQIKVEEGLIRNVKILGDVSKNGAQYTKRAMQEAVSNKVYEGSLVNIDHFIEEGGKRKAGRSYRDRFGSLQNIRYRESSSGRGALFGDLKFNPNHELANQFVWDIENNTQDVGLSHDAMGTARKSPTKGRVVESIDNVKSVDIVAHPATNETFFESTEGTMKVRKKTRKKKTVEKSLVESNLETFELDGIDSDTVVELIESDTDEGSVGLLKNVVILIEAEQDEDSPETILEKLIEMYDFSPEVDVLEVDKKKLKNSSKKSSSASSEVRELREQLADMQREITIRDLAGGVELSPVQMKAAKALDDDELEEFIESLVEEVDDDEEGAAQNKSVLSKKRPVSRSSKRFAESKRGGGEELNLREAFGIKSKTSA